MKKRDELEKKFKSSKQTYRSPSKSNDDTIREMMKLVSVDIKYIMLEQQTQWDDTKALKEK